MPTCWLNVGQHVGQHVGTVCGKLKDFNCTLNQLGLLRRKNIKNVGISYLNINSVRTKLDSLFEIVEESVDVLTIAETKLDEAFADVQFIKQGIRKPFRLDIRDKSGGYSLR